MRKCLACQDAIPESRRKDAKYCSKPACRARARRRSRDNNSGSTKGRPGFLRVADDSVVFTCSCGGQLELKISQLDPGHPSPPPRPLSECESPDSIHAAIDQILSRNKELIEKSIEKIISRADRTSDPMSPLSSDSEKKDKQVDL